MALEPLVIYTIISIIGFILFIWIISGFKIIKQWERAPLLRLGKYRGLKGPGLVWYLRGIYSIPMKISTRTLTYTFRSEQTLTKDNVSVSVDAIMYYNVIDPEKAFLQVEEYLIATNWAAQSTLREVMGKVELNELLSERDKISTHLQEIIDSKTERWGIKVTSVEVRDVVLPQNLIDVMARQAEAERERQARVTLATAEAQASFKMVEAAEEYTKNEKAMELRWMNLLYEAAVTGKSTIIMVPANLPIAGFTNAFAVKGIQKMTSDNKNENK
ncbi:MAG: SPFH domain-containing protein [Candidatus Odinarchaeota archaeon]